MSSSGSSGGNIWGVRREEEVGILERIGADLVRVQATLKERFSDFHVNEIDKEGRILHLTELTPPTQEVKTMSEEEEEELLKLVGVDKRGEVLQLLEGLKEKAKGVTLSPVEINVSEMGKDERKKVHAWVSTLTPPMTSETLEKGAGGKWISISPGGRGRGPNSHRRKAGVGRYTHCLLYKEGMDTTEAVSLLANKLNLKPGLISYAGIKDKRAKTVQKIALSNIPPHRVLGATKYLKGLEVGNFSNSDSPLSLGDLGGNHFKLLLKNLRGTEEDLFSCMSSLKEKGFLNYFGLQRFGSFATPTSSVGKELLKGNWLQAFDLILTPRANDPHWMGKAKGAWLEGRDAQAAVELIPRGQNRSPEAQLLSGLAMCDRNDYQGAFMRIPRGVRLLYLHAFQALLWNKLASFRVRRYGHAHPVAGDLVHAHKGTLLDLEDEGGKEEEGEGDGERKKGVEDVGLPQVRILTEEDLSKGEWSLGDVLLPLPGSEVTYPQNEVKEELERLLGEEGIDPSAFINYKPMGDRPRGAYRRLLVRPSNVKAEVKGYVEGEDLDALIPSDYDLLRGGGRKVNDRARGTTPSGEERKAVVLEFSLPSSSYATMALREVLKEEGASKDSTPPPIKKQKIE